MKTYKDYVLSSPNVSKGNSTYDKQKNRVSYQRYVNNYLAEQQKNEQLAQIEKNKNAALSESAIASERARQYVNAVNKHYGIAGTGYGESKAIDLYSQEAKRRAEINNAHSEQENEALRAYQQAIANAALAENEAIGNIELAEDEENEAKRQAYVAKLQEIADNPEVSDEDFSRYYKEYAQYLGSEDALLKQDLEARAAEFDTEKAQDKTRVSVASSQGVKLGDAVTLDELVNDNNALGEYKDTGEQTALINAIINLARTKGVDSIEGKAIDVNYGAGKAFYYYTNGNFYKISKSDAKKLGIVEIDAQGNVISSNEATEKNSNKTVASHVAEGTTEFVKALQKAVNKSGGWANYYKEIVEKIRNANNSVIGERHVR